MKNTKSTPKSKKQFKPLTTDAKKQIKGGSGIGVVNIRGSISDASNQTM